MNVYRTWQVKRIEESICFVLAFSTLLWGVGDIAQLVDPALATGLL
jgi:hypothetical protein